MHHPGFYWLKMMTCKGIEDAAWDFLVVSIPVVVIFAPIGALISSFLHRLEKNMITRHFSVFLGKCYLF